MKNGEIILCKGIKMDKGFENVLSYNESDMVTLCRNNAVATTTKYSILDPSVRSIDVALPYSTCIPVNYIAFKNPYYGNKWYFGFVEEIVYVNNNTTTIKYKLDVFSTWYSSMNVGKAFIEREHVSDDTFGLHTYPENLETGEFIINECDEFTRMDLVNTYIGVSRVQDGLPSQYGGTMNNLYSGLTYFCFTDNIEAGKFIKGYDRTGHGDNIITVFVLPKALYDFDTGDTLTINNDSGTPYETCTGKRVTDTTIPTELIRKTIYRNTSLNGYVPKNNKMFTGEFNYLYVTNNGGTDVKYNYEDFVSDPHFKIDGVITVGGSIRLMPTNYKKYDCLNPNTRYSWSEYNYGITCAKYPTCSWNNDAYTNWLTQNATNFLVDDIKFGYSQFNSLPNEENASSIVNVMNTDYVGNAIGHYLDRMSLKKSYSFMPIQAKGSINAGDITLSEGAIGFWYYKMSIKYEYAKICDDFLSRFGYRVNEIKTPNLNSRTKFNYIKVGSYDELITGDIPASDLEEINNIFRKGVTIFHDYTSFGDYTQTNAIVTP